MNNSGHIINDLFKYTKGKIEDVLIICDTLDLPPGKIRLKRKGSSSGQKGLLSIIRISGTEEILRLFIGIGRPYSQENVISYVLARPGKDQKVLINESLEKACDGILRLLSEPVESVMNAIN